MGAFWALTVMAAGAAKVSSNAEQSRKYNNVLRVGLIIFTLLNPIGADFSMKLSLRDYTWELHKKYQAFKDASKHY